MKDLVTTHPHILQFERIRKNLHHVFTTMEANNMKCISEYQELLKDVGSIEGALKKFMQVNDQQSLIISDLTKQNCEYRNEQ